MSSSINRVFGGGQDDVHSVSDDNNKMNNGQSYPRQAQQEEEGALALLAMNNSTKPSLPRSCLKSSLSTSTNKGRISLSTVERTQIMFDHPQNQLCMSREQMHMNYVEKTRQIGKEIGLEVRERDIEALQLEELQFPEDASERNKQVEIERSATNVKVQFLETNKVDKLPPYLEELYRRCRLGVWHSSGPTDQMLETFTASCADREIVHKTAELKIEDKLSEKKLNDCRLLLSLQGMLMGEDADDEISKLSEDQLAFCEQQMNNCSLKTYLVVGVTASCADREMVAVARAAKLRVTSDVRTASTSSTSNGTSSSKDTSKGGTAGEVGIVPKINNGEEQETTAKLKIDESTTPKASQTKPTVRNKARQQASTIRDKRKYQSMSINDNDGENMKQTSTSKRKKHNGKSFLFGSQIKQPVEFVLVHVAGRGRSTKSKTLNGEEPDIPTTPEEDLKVPNRNVAADGEDPAALGRADDDTAEHRPLQQEAGPPLKSNPSTPVPPKMNDVKGGESLDKCEKSKGSTGGNGKGGCSAKSGSDAGKLLSVGKVAPTSTPKANDIPTTPGEDIKVSDGNTAGEERGDDKTAEPRQLPQEFNDDEDAEFEAADPFEDPEEDEAKEGPPPASLPSTKNLKVPDTNGQEPKLKTPDASKAADKDERVEFGGADPLEPDDDDESKDGTSNAKATSTSITSERPSVLSWDCDKRRLNEALRASNLDTISIGDLLKPLSQSSLSLDFTHLTSALASLRQAHPTADFFLAVFKEGNTPVVVTFIVPQGFVPTSLVGYYNEDQGTDEIYPFDAVGYSWVQVEGVEGGAQFLVCDKEDSLLPINSKQNGGCIFIIPPAYLKRNKGKRKPSVSLVTYTFLDGNDNEQSTSWDRSIQPSMDDHVSNIIKDYFSQFTLSKNDCEEVKANKATGSKQAAKHVKKQIDSVISTIRSAMIQDGDRFFNEVGYNEDVLKSISFAKIYSVNHPSPTNLDISDTYFDNMTADSVIINHSLFDNCTGLLHRVSKPVIKRINFMTVGALSPLVTKLCLTLIVDLLDNSRYLDVPEKISVFHIGRILQHMGKDPDDVDYSDERVQESPNIMHFLINKLHSLLETIGHNPQNLNDFVCNFLFKASDEKIITDHSTGPAKSVRISRANNDMLELCFEGGEETYVSTDPTKLKEFVTLQGIIDLIITLLVNPPGTAITVPAGSRDNDEAGSSDSQIEEANCLKQALLHAPNKMLSPSGKRRVKMTFPDHEITKRQVINLCETKIKTIAIKQLNSEDLMEIALSAKVVMIGVFGSGSRKHCIMIDGTDGEHGTITDPHPEFNKTMVRSQRSMEKLGVTSFVEFYELKRVELSDKSRKGAQKRLNLPFCYTK